MFHGGCLDFMGIGVDPSLSSDVPTSRGANGWRFLTDAGGSALEVPRARPTDPRTTRVVVDHPL